VVCRYWASETDKSVKNVRQDSRYLKPSFRPRNKSINGQNLNGSELWTLEPSGMLCRVVLVRTDVSEELSAPFIKVTRIGELAAHFLLLRSVRRLLVTASVVPSSPILVTLMKEALRSSETSVLTRATRRNIPKDAILQSHRRENLKSYRAWTSSIVRNSKY
jgi:hypothetical protein